MKKILLSLVILAVTFTSFSQNFPSEIRPPSWKMTNLENPVPYKLQKVDVDALKAEDANDDLSAPKPWRFGYELSVNHDFMTHGEWTTLDNGDKIWRISYKSNGATSLNFMFTEFYLPEGTKLFVYNDAKDDLLRPFSHHNNNPEEVLGTWLVQGDQAWIEYYQPAYITEQAKLTIGGVVHGYRTAEMFQAVGLNDAQDCHYDVDCDISPVPDPFDLNTRKEEVKRATAMLLVGGSGFCSGTLINNTANDQTPYVLTANHCGGNEGFWSFRFNWRSPNPSCGTTTPSTNGSFDQTVSGAVLRASNSQSDMELVEITDASFFNNNPDVVWAGWNRSTTAVPPTSFGIHHGAGDIQKVTRWDAPAQRIAINFNGDPNTQVWFLQQYGLGYIEPGSSGSSLYDQNGHVIGIAAAVSGSQSCNGTTPNGQVFYGRFGEAWDFGGSVTTRLRDWLDPLNTGQEVLDIYPAANIFDTDASVAPGNTDTELCGVDFAPQITLINRGNLPLNSAEITYFLDADPPTVVNWTGTLDQDNVEVVATPVYSNLSPGAHILSLNVSNPNGIPDENPSNDNFFLFFNVTEKYVTNNITLDITTDNFGDETTWEVYDTSVEPNALVASGPSTPYGSNQTFQEIIPLPTIDNCYRFVILDSVGDGICCGFGNGSYSLSDDDGNVIISGGNFGSSELIDFEAVSSLGLPNVSLEGSIAIYPNPVENTLNIKASLNRSQALNYVVYNIIGQKVMYGNLLPADENEVDMSQLIKGTYFVKITSDSGSFTKKIIKR